MNFNEKQYAEFMKRYALFSFGDYLKQIFPDRHFEKEEVDDRIYLKTHCMLQPFDSEFPTLYFDDARATFRCFHCGKMGGPLDLIREYFNINNREAFERVCKQMGFKVTCKKTIEKLIKELDEFGEGSNAHFDHASLGKEMSQYLASIGLGIPRI